MVRKRTASAVEIANDPSLRWCDYQKWESIWSDDLNQSVRFVRREGDRVVIATAEGIKEFEGTFDHLRVRRITATPSYRPSRPPIEILADRVDAMTRRREAKK